MDYMISTLLPRGQVTIPKKLREKYGLKAGPVKIFDGGRSILIKAFYDGGSIKPIISKVEYLKKLKKYNGIYWKKADDKALKIMESKEKVMNW